MTPKTVRLGYEVGSGYPVDISLHHLAACGMTQLAGKTTAIEGLIHRSGMPALAFITKQGESAFEDTGIEVTPFYLERSDWRYMSELLEALMDEGMKFERSWIIRACEHTHTPEEVLAKVEGFLAPGHKLRGLDESVYITLREYLKLIIPQIRKAKLSRELKLFKGLNVMRLENYEPELQKLIIASTIEHLHKYYRGIIVIIPEAWEMLPYKGSPVRLPAELFIRKGAAVGNYLWIDSQDIAGVNRVFFRQIDNWLLGRQRDPNEVERNLDAIPMSKTAKPKPEEIQQLTLGYFYVCAGNSVKKVYAQPAWLNEETAVKIAKGEIPVEDAEKHRINLADLEEGVDRLPELFESAVKIEPAPNVETTASIDHVQPQSSEEAEKQAAVIKLLEYRLEETRAQKTALELQLDAERKKKHEWEEQFEITVETLTRERDETRNALALLERQLSGSAKLRDGLREALNVDLLIDEEAIVRKVLERIPQATQPQSADKLAVNIEEIVVEVQHSEQVETVTTSNVAGKLLYALIVDLKGEPSDMNAILETCREHGWSIGPNTFSPEIGKLVRDGKLVKENTKPLKWRPPRKVTIRVKQTEEPQLEMETATA